MLMTSGSPEKAKGGVAKAEAPPPPHYRKAVCPLREGDLTFFFPSNLSAESVKAAVAYFGMMMVGQRRHDDVALSLMNTARSRSAP
jgi:hypothetical protein